MANPDSAMVVAGQCTRCALCYTLLLPVNGLGGGYCKQQDISRKQCIGTGQWQRRYFVRMGATVVIIVAIICGLYRLEFY